MFTMSPLGFQGNAARNFLRGPGLFSWDMSLSKNFVLPSDRGTLEFRAEIFNFLNHANLNNPSTDPTSATFGRITSKDNSRRDIQLSLRYVF